MPSLKVIYIAGFNLDRNTGRNKATKEKANTLRMLLGEGNFLIYFPTRFDTNVFANLPVLFFDLRLVLKLSNIKRGSIVIERQAILPLTNLMLRLKGIQIIYELHSDLKSEIPYFNKSWFQKQLIYLLSISEKINLKISSGIIINNPALESVVNKYHKPLLCCYNGANTMDFYPINQLDCRFRLGLIPSNKYFLFSGMVSKWHGVEYLIKIFQHSAISSRSNYHLLILGTGFDAYSFSLKKQTEKDSNIHFIDQVPANLVNLYINAADVCLLPVKEIRTTPGSPLKLYDYIACGKPVIGQKDVKGYSDEIINYDLGGIVNFYDTRNSVYFIIDFIEKLNPEKFLVNNRMMAESYLAWKCRIEKWLSFILGLKKLTN